MSRNAGQTDRQTEAPDGQTAGETSPWTIKSVPVETRLKAVKAAAAQDVTMAVWLTDAVNRLADQQAGNLILPPGKPEANPLPEIDLPGLAAALNATVNATTAAGGTVPKALGRDATATLRRYMRAARGLPARQTPRQTIPGNRQTLTLTDDVEKQECQS